MIDVRVGWGPTFCQVSALRLARGEPRSGPGLRKEYRFSVPTSDGAVHLPEACRDGA